MIIHEGNDSKKALLEIETGCIIERGRESTGGKPGNTTVLSRGKGVFSRLEIRKEPISPLAGNRSIMVRLSNGGAIGDWSRFSGSTIFGWNGRT
jgi:hypothetical protein